MPDLPARLLAHVREAGLFSRPGLALLAVSGGEDSVALLDLLAALAADLGLALAVGHVDHGIAPESPDVAEQVMGWAVRYGLPARMVTLDLGPAASETRARRERYHALRGLQRSLSADYLVTAHQADDQVETVLYRIVRGSGAAGLAGIPSRGPHGLVRPLLPFRRAELRDWLAARFPAPGPPLPLYRDPANLDPRHDRSWLRTRVLPLLRERFGAAVERNLLAVQEGAARERSAWTALVRSLPDLALRHTRRGVEVARGPVQKYDKTLSEALLRAVAREAGCMLGPRRAVLLRAFLQRSTSGQRMPLGQGWVAEVAFDRLLIQRAAPADVSGVAQWGAGERGATRWGTWEIAWRLEPAGATARGGFSTWVSARPGEVRAMRRGERVFPLGGIGHRPVRRLLMEAKVPRSERACYPILARGADILWVPGVCRAAVDVPVPGQAALRLDVHAVRGSGGE